MYVYTSYVKANKEQMLEQILIEQMLIEQMLQANP
jgi:hypothetical protein